MSEAGTHKRRPGRPLGHWDLDPVVVSLRLLAHDEEGIANTHLLLRQTALLQAIRSYGHEYRPQSPREVRAGGKLRFPGWLWSPQSTASCR